MRGTLAVARKEVLSYFFAPMAYIVVAVFLVMNGFLFSVLLAALSQPGSNQASSPMIFFFGGSIFTWLFLLVTVPAITMRLGAEETKSGTLETLLTAPVTDLGVVLGKYLGALAVYAACWLPTVLYLWVLTRFSDVDFGPVLSGYLGILLVGMLFTSVGLYSSTRTPASAATTMTAPVARATVSALTWFRLKATRSIATPVRSCAPITALTAAARNPSRSDSGVPEEVRTVSLHTSTGRRPSRPRTARPSLATPGSTPSTRESNIRSLSLEGGRGPGNHPGPRWIPGAASIAPGRTEASRPGGERRILSPGERPRRLCGVMPPQGFADS